jgi:hypothetical protein
MCDTKQKISLKKDESIDFLDEIFLFMFQFCFLCFFAI